MTHELKILECYASAKVHGDKLFEIRDNRDRGFQNNSLIYIAIHGSTYFQFNEDYIGKFVFTDKSEAESRLAELKGEK